MFNTKRDRICVNNIKREVFFSRRDGARDSCAISPKGQKRDFLKRTKRRKKKRFEKPPKAATREGPKSFFTEEGFFVRFLLALSRFLFPSRHKKELFYSCCEKEEKKMPSSSSSFFFFEFVFEAREKLCPSCISLSAAFKRPSKQVE